MSKLLVTAGIVISANGIFLLVSSNFNLGIALICLLGIMLLMWGIFYDKIREKTKSGVWRVVKAAVISLLCAEILLVGFVCVYGQFDNADYSEDAVIVLGAGIRGDKVTLPLKMRLDKAVEYHKKNPEAYIVVTGGQGLQETVTEAYAMEKYLLANGVDKSVIIKEERATSTNENMRFSKQLLDPLFEGNYKTVVITNNFHIYRGVYIAELEGFKNVTHIHAGLQWYNILPCYLRESLAILKMWVFG